MCPILKLFAKCRDSRHQMDNPRISTLFPAVRSSYNINSASETIRE
jgi:hypothetical protein